jgi:hypothetical protein
MLSAPAIAAASIAVPAETSPLRMRSDSLLVANLYGFLPPAVAVSRPVAYESTTRAPDAVAPVAPVVASQPINDRRGRTIDAYA